MLVEHARGIAADWVNEIGVQLDGFRGAFLHGSVNWMENSAQLAPTSDVDIIVVVDQASAQPRLGKFDYRGLILEVTVMGDERFSSAGDVLGRYNLAGSFQSARIVADPTGQLTDLQSNVAAHYAERSWVIARCSDARQKVLSEFPLRGDDPLPSQVTSWLFSTGVTTHIVLVAGLKNPTVRTRYLAVRDLLSEYGQSSFYPSHLDLLGCADMKPPTVAHHLAALEPAFDYAASIITSDLFFAPDISDAGRLVAIDGSRELIERGDHREAVFWIVATFARVRTIIELDAPPGHNDLFDRAFRDLLLDLGIRSVDDLRTRLELTRAFVPEVWEVAMRIVDMNPDVRPDPAAGLLF